MGGDPSRRNQNFYCIYHRDKGHTFEQCMVLKDHLEQLMRAGYLKELFYRHKKPGCRAGYTTLGKPSFTPFRSDRSYSCSFNGYPSDQEESNTDSGSSGKLFG